ncbi:MAG: type VI secretion protein IcmF/TssM N-terminal domain-containing protein [Pirellula sp.]
MTSRIASWVRITLAGWVSIGVGISLLAIGGLVGVAFHTRSERISWGEYLSWAQLGLMAGLWLAICFASYWLVRISLSQLPPSGIGLIEAWKSGIDALAKRGISIRDVPIFLVLGCENSKNQLTFMQQIGMATAIPICPENSNAPIRWFISDDRIIVVCQDIGMYTLAQSRLEVHLARLQAELPFSDVCLPMTLVDDQESGAGDSFKEAHHSSSDFHGINGLDEPLTSELEQPAVIPFPGLADIDEPSGDRYDTTQKESLVAESSAPIFSPWVDRIETTSHSYVAERKAVSHKPVTNNEVKEQRLFGQLDRTEELVALVQKEDDSIESPLVFEQDIASQAVTRGKLSVSILNSSERIRSQIGLSDLCNLIGNARGELAPINGILVRVDTAALVRCNPLAQQCGQELRQDLEQLQQQLGIQTPVSIVLDNFHQFDSFQQLIKRLGPNTTAGIAIGELYDVRRSISTVNITVACSRLTRSLTRAVYHAFKTQDGKLRPQNHKLFPLLHLCRGSLKDSINDFLVQAFPPADFNNSATGESLLHGLYAMGSGDTETQRGFGSHVLRNLSDESESLAWTPDRLRLEKRYRARVSFLQALCLLLTISATILLWLSCR